jgi:ribosomal protection tetracycline resistance protein
MRTLNLGILAHVDAGKTSLTERLLFNAGVIETLGRVDRGDTTTDTLALERERGITIKSAVVSFRSDDIVVNLIDTPGHPDFIAEVDRTLGLLDGAVLVVSAVEGVQSQTRVLMRALQRLRIATIVFVNKTDRLGADVDRVVDEIRAKLTPKIVRIADPEAFDEMVGIAADNDDRLLASFVAGEPLDPALVRRRFASCSRRGLVHAVLAGSAMTGDGVDALRAAITEFLPARSRDAAAPLSARVVSIDRRVPGVARPIVQIVHGALHVRDRIDVDGRPRRITAIDVFDQGALHATDTVAAGRFARVAGLGPVRIGDTIGAPQQSAATHFPPPPFEAVVSPTDPRARHALHTALSALAAEDPLIGLRQDDERGELSISLYGPVQAEVIRETLRREFGVDVTLSEPTAVCIERIAGVGEAEEIMLAGRSETRPFLAGVGIRVEPAPPGTGITVDTGLETGRLPMAFIHAIEESARATMRQGLHGWDVPDCAVTMINSGYWPRQSHSHGTFDRNMSSTATDFRQLTPVVVIAALRRAGTVVHEQVHRFHLEAPRTSLGALTRLLAGLGATIEPPTRRGDDAVLEGTLAVTRLQSLRRQLPGLTNGDSFVETEFDGHQPVSGRPPSRDRVGLDPGDRARYLRAMFNRSPAR